jgi:hypothetical protein
MTLRHSPDYWARPNSKLWRVARRLLATPGQWVTGQQLHDAYGERAWTHDSALAQLRKKGMMIEPRKVTGMDMYEYRVILAPELARHLARTEAEIAERKAHLPSVGGATAVSATARPAKPTGSSVAASGGKLGEHARGAERRLLSPGCDPAGICRKPAPDSNQGGPDTDSYKSHVRPVSEYEERMRELDRRAEDQERAQAQKGLFR